MKEDAVKHDVAASNETESRLLDSALTIFSEKGYEGTSVREIIERACCTRPVLYYYFANKEDLFRRLVYKQFVKMLEVFDSVFASVTGCRDRLRLLIRSVFERAESDPASVRLLAQVFLAPPKEGPDLTKEPVLNERFARLVMIMQEGLDKGELAGGNPHALALAFSGLMYFHIMAKSRYPELSLSGELASGLADLFMDGACVTGGAQSLLPSPFVDGYIPDDTCFYLGMERS